MINNVAGTHLAHDQNMNFQRLKDAFMFSSEFARWERLSDLHSVLIGNRVAEIHNRSPSSGGEANIERLRSIHSRVRYEVMQQSKSAGLSSRQAAVHLICVIGDAYMSESDEARPPAQLYYCLSVLAPKYLPIRRTLSERWSKWLDESEEFDRAKYNEVKSAMPALYEARREATLLAPTILKGIQDRDASSEVFDVWMILPSRTQETERQISKRSNLPMSHVIACIQALELCGVVTVIGTALDEPRYWKTPASILKGEREALRIYLDAKKTSGEPGGWEN